MLHPFVVLVSPATTHVPDIKRPKLILFIFLEIIELSHVLNVCQIEELVDICCIILCAIPQHLPLIPKELLGCLVLALTLGLLHLVGDVLELAH